MSEELNLSQRIKKISTQKDWDRLNRRVYNLFKDGIDRNEFKPVRKFP